MLGTECRQNGAPACCWLSRIYAVRGCAKEPQRREGRREKTKGVDAQSNHHSVTQFQVAESGLSLRPSRLCGLMGLCSIAWPRLSVFLSATLGLTRRLRFE